MRQGENLLYLARKEYGIALGAQLRKFKITDYKIYRVYPNGDIEYLHPKDGVFPRRLTQVARLSIRKTAALVKTLNQQS